MTFKIVAKSSATRARAGILETPHGEVETPVFMPVGTQATVKGMTVPTLKSIGADIILGNTYHLSLRPGSERIRNLGGLHKFMNWDRPILTDSGGYQVFSLQNIRKIHESGVTFRSHLDGSEHVFTPQRVIDLQRDFGSDIMMPLDICTPFPATEAQIAKDVEVTSVWEKQAFNYWKALGTKQLLFAIIQGGTVRALREKSAADLAPLDFSGFAIGGLSVGEPKPLLQEFTTFSAALLPEHKPRYLMGVGHPEDLVHAIHSGVDMFDCVAPTRLARHGQAFTSAGRLTIRNSAFADDARALDERCACSTCQFYSRAYLHHLFKTGEILGIILMTTHNLFYLIELVKSIRRDLLR